MNPSYPTLTATLRTRAWVRRKNKRQALPADDLWHFIRVSFPELKPHEQDYVFQNSEGVKYGFVSTLTGEGL